jgi:hypothetical protein
MDNYTPLLQTLPIVIIIKPYFFGRIPFTKGVYGLYNPVVPLFMESEKNVRKRRLRRCDKKYFPFY